MPSGDGLDDHAINQPDRKLNCAGCHFPATITGQLPTGSTHVNNKWAPLFSDLLLNEVRRSTVSAMQHNAAASGADVARGRGRPDRAASRHERRGTDARWRGRCSGAAKHRAAPKASSTVWTTSRLRSTTADRISAYSKRFEGGKFSPDPQQSRLVKDRVSRGLD